MPSEKTMDQMINCICPCCEKEYTTKLFWTGKGIPKIICEQCKKNTRGHETRENYNKLYNGMSKPRAAAL